MTAAENKSPQRMKFDRKDVTKKLIEADEFIESLCRFLPPHLNQTRHSPENKKKDNQKKKAGEKKPIVKNIENISEGINKISLRGKSIEELQQKLDELKGKKKSYAAKLLQKGLKNRIKKKLWKEERKKKRLEKKMLKSSNVKSETKDKSKEDEPKVMETEETELDNSEIINEKNLNSSDMRDSKKNLSLVWEKKTKSKVKQQRKRKSM